MKITIVRRILLTLAVALVGQLFIGLYGIWALHESDKRLRFIAKDTLPSVMQLDEANKAFSQLRVLAYRHALTDAASEEASFERDSQAADTTLQQALSTYAQHYISDSQDDALLQREQALTHTYRDVRKTFFALSHSGDKQAARESLVRGPMAQIARQMNSALDAHRRYNYENADHQRELNAAAFARSLALSIAALVTVLLVASALSARTVALLKHGLNGLRDTLQHVDRDLDLSRRAPVHHHDEIGLTAEAFNALMSRVAGVIGTVRESSESVRAASCEVAASSVDLSARTEEQAASLEQTAASLEEITSMIRQNADHGTDAADKAERAGEVAVQGDAVAQQMRAAMNDVQASASRIREITALIESIAFQTNILSLNAAVEAARAGEHGRGFAVVASEVRALAQRSAVAAKDIKALIDASDAQVGTGTALATRLADSMGGLRVEVVEVAALLRQIASASQEQSRGVEQINAALGQMDGVTQQNAALVEETAAAASTLEAQSDRLLEVVAAFRVAA